MACLLGGDVIKVIGVYFAYGWRLNLLETLGVGGSLDQESTPYVQIEKSYNTKSFLLFTLCIWNFKLRSEDGAR